MGSHTKPYVLETHGAAKHTDVTRELFIPANECYVSAGTPANLGYYSSVKGLADNNEPNIYATKKVPDDFVSFTSLEAVWASVAAAGNMYWLLAAYWAAAGEAYSTHDELSGVGVTATGGAWIINVQESTTPLALANLAKGDYLGISFQRAGANALDTLDEDVYVLGFLFTYIAEQ